MVKKKKIFFLNSFLKGIFEMPTPRDKGIFFNEVKYVFDNNEHKSKFLHFLKINVEKKKFNFQLEKQKQNGFI